MLRIEVVAELLSHASVKVIENHYAPWMKVRQKRLEEAFDDVHLIMLVGDFPVTRATLNRLDEWFIPITVGFLPLKRVPLKKHGDGAFWWNFKEETAEAVIIAKAARAISGLRAAMLLADRGYVTECGAILRTVSDFSIEIGFLLDAIMSDKQTVAQNEFVRQFFLPIPETPDDEQPKERWVPRKDILAGYMRWAGREQNGKKISPKQVRRLRDVTEYLNYGYDKYVHGGYLTAMELYDGRSETFMLRGNTYEHAREISKRAVASKLHNFLAEFAGIADVVAKNPALSVEICSAGLKLFDSEELS